jgi:endoglucanase Acf2
LSKLGRILLVAEEVNEICTSNNKDNEYDAMCSNAAAALPSLEEMSDALDRLRRGVEVWINGTAKAPFVYDSAWGGVVNCGCYFDHGTCSNTFPDCPAFFDQGLNFGNGTLLVPFHLHVLIVLRARKNLRCTSSASCLLGFYNDHHFHYGYHIYAAAVVAHFDPKWGRKYWEQVLLLVRDIANPSKEDSAFPLFRHKDWYQGSSWASGVPLPPFLNGKNQESSSEAIAAYEAVALYGGEMVSEASSFYSSFTCSISTTQP